MRRATAVEVSARPLPPLRAVIGERRFSKLEGAMREARDEMGTARFWNISSTAKGGGVAEMLAGLVGYARAGDVDTRWLVIEGDAEFFGITKRIHNRMHGVVGDDGALGPSELRGYRDVLAANAPSILEEIAPGDIVLLHDPQTLGLADLLTKSGASVLWRCHIGSESVNAHSKEAWAFLAPFVKSCRELIFSRRGFVPPQVEGARVLVIPPSIDPCSDKNRKLSPTELIRALRAMGLVASDRLHRGRAPGPHARYFGEEPPFAASDRLVVQVSRWDHLKDMQGVMTGFAEGATARSDAVLALVGPAVANVADDPEGQAVLGECIAIWETLKPSVRRRIHLFTLPMDDVRANAVMVNAVQTHATIVVQKSLMEGFGLTVAEALWKAKPVIGSAVGGISDQLADGNGILLSDPADLGTFSDAVVSLLDDSRKARLMGQRGRLHVRRNYLVDRHLLQYANVLGQVRRSDPF